MPFLIETIAAVAGTDTHMSFADLFAGTGVVGKTFKEKGYSVIANDIQYYSYILNKHLIENVPPLDVQEILDDLNDLPGADGFVTAIIAPARAAAGIISPTKTAGNATRCGSNWSG